jgi:aminoglycoside phosphotransferase (APT) family kinase protein
MQHEFRAGLEFDVAALEAWLAARLPGFEGPLQVRQFSGGQSNPTYQLQSPGRAYVLRRKPPGALLPSAHAIEREFRVMRALAEGSAVPIARPLLLCEDTTVIGTAFYVMEHAAGRIFWDPTLPEVPASGRASVFRAMNGALASLHAADPAAIGLGDYGRPEGYVARQVARWSRQYAGDAQIAGRVPEIEQLIEWLPKHLPSQEPRPAVVHGDFRIDNLVFHPTEPQVIAVLDWELSTIGDPHADFAYHVMMYRMDSGPIPGLAGRDLVALGLPSEAEYVSWYCERRGIPEVPQLDFYVAFCLFRLAGIFHGIRGRVQRGTAVSPQAQRYAAEVETIARIAWREALKV